MKNRIPESLRGELPTNGASPATRAFPLPKPLFDHFVMLQSAASIATGKRDGFLEGVKIMMGVPAGHVFNVGSAQFEPDRRNNAEPDVGPSDAAAENAGSPSAPSPNGNDTSGK